MTASWPDPNPRTGQSFAEDSPVGDRWQNRLKKLLYPIVLPIRTRFAGLRRAVDCLRPPIFSDFRGSEFDYVVSRLGKSRIETGTILIQGVGRQREFRFWAPYSPKRLVGVDLTPEPNNKHTSAVETACVAADLAELPFAGDTFDGVASINTWEHVQRPEATLAEARRVARSGGWLLATFGPLYGTFGGDHFSDLRGGLEHGYNHLLLDSNAYSEFVDHMTIPGIDVVDGSPKDGRLYIDLDLFSHLGWRDYHRMFSEVLHLDLFTTHLDPESVKFRDQFPKKWSALLEKGYAEEDLLVSTVVVLGRFKSTPTQPAVAESTLS